MFNKDVIDTRFRLSFIVKEQNIKLREFLQKKSISKRTLTATKFDGGQLLVNGSEENVRHSLSAGDEVTIIFPSEQPSEGLYLENGELTILYEDEAILIVDKPAGQGTIPSRDHPVGTIANFVAGKFARENIPATVHIVTRLDRDTSGLICIAKNRHIHHLLSEQMKTTGFYRKYISFVEGHVDESNFIIEQPIGRKDGSIIERIVRDDGQYARTDVEVIERFTTGAVDYTQIALVLHTGRTHQIRVHMEWAGHPLLGDDLYGGTHEILSRQALHCGTLCFMHPLTGNRIEFNSVMPDDLAALIK